MKVATRVSRIFNDLRWLVKDLWNAAGECGFCCGIRLDHTVRTRPDNHIKPLVVGVKF